MAKMTLYFTDNIKKDVNADFAFKLYGFKFYVHRVQTSTMIVGGFSISEKQSGSSLKTYGRTKAEAIIKSKRFLKEKGKTKTQEVVAKALNIIRSQKFVYEKD